MVKIHELVRMSEKCDDAELLRMALANALAQWKRDREDEIYRMDWAIPLLDTWQHKEDMRKTRDNLSKELKEFSHDR